MTWAKFGVEYFDQCADAGLTSDAFRTHTEAIGYLYRLDRDDVTDMTIKPKELRKFATCDEWAAAAAELLHVGFWRFAETHYVLVHHAEVVRQSLMAQKVKRERDRRLAAAKRAKPAEKDVASDVASDVANGVIGGTDRQTDNQTIIDVGSQEEQRSEHDGWDGIPVAQPPKPAPTYSFLQDIAKGGAAA